MEKSDNYCRLCAKPQEASLMIFGKETASLQLQRKLNKYLLIEVEEDDKLPKCICPQCCKQLNDVCQFIDRARDAQEILQQQNLYDHMEVDAINSMPHISEVTYGAQKTTANLADVTHVAETIFFFGADGESVSLTRNNIESTDDRYKPFACNLCHRTFLSEMALKNHDWMHAANQNGTNLPYVCAGCDKDFTFKTDYLNHLRCCVRKLAKLPRSCPDCNRTFRSEKTFKSHILTHSSEKSLYTCDVCQRSYSTRSTFKNHMVSHSNEKPFQCTVCKKRFKRRQELRFHFNRHTGARPFKCPKCDKRFSSSSNCYTHKIRMHPATREEERSKSPGVVNKVKGKFECPVCTHTFNKSENFSYHMYRHTGEKPYHCTYCEDKFVTENGINLHYQRKHPNLYRPSVRVTPTSHLLRQALETT